MGRDHHRSAKLLPSSRVPPTPPTRHAREQRMNQARTLLTILTMLTITIICRPQPVMAASGYASAYGPGLYGNRTACGQTLTPSTRGVAHRSLPCGAWLRVCHHRRCTITRVIDRGPFHANRVLDITEGATRMTWGMSARSWGVRLVSYTRWYKREL